MSRQQAAAERTISILHSIVQSYIETGEPVASGTIARKLGSSLSAASIRNVMAELYDSGYLCQPHTSAGRVPTEKAFQSYVKSLAARRILAGEIERLRTALSEADTVQDRVQRSSQILLKMTHGFCIAAAIPTSSQTLDQVDLLRLSEHRVLMVVVTTDHLVRNRVVSLSEAISQDELFSIRNYININFSGWALSDVQAEIERRLEAESAAYDAILKRLNALCEQGFLSVGVEADVHTEGAWNLLGLDLHLTREKMRELFRALEQKKKILHLLDCFLQSGQSEVAVQIGLSDAHPSMGELSLIGLSVRLPSGLSGKIAVLGPMRMNYERVISAVLHVGQAFQSV